jgi:hypothetical protein
VRVLLCGELAYNPERIGLLADAGCELHGLWIEDPLPFMTVGPGVPRVRDTTLDAVPGLGCDVALCLLNWRMVPLALRLHAAVPGLPLVVHLKEAPQRLLARGEWGLLVALLRVAHTVIAISEEQAAFYAAVLPGVLRRPPLVADGDLPPASRLGEPAAWDGPTGDVCVVGRAAGVDEAFVAALAGAGITVHAYGEAPPGAVAHPPVAPEDWAAELGRYDGGLLHRFTSANGGDPRIASWDDLNVPARVPTYLAAGLPLLLPAQPGGVTSVNRLVERLGIGVAYARPADLADAPALRAAREAVARERHRFTFEAVLPTVLDALRAAAR